MDSPELQEALKIAISNGSWPVAIVLGVMALVFGGLRLQKSKEQKQADDRQAVREKAADEVKAQAETMTEARDQADVFLGRND